MVAFSDLIATVTLDNVRATFAEAAAIVEWAVESLPPLARLRKLADSAQRTIFAFTQVQSAIVRGGFKDFATGSHLEALAEQVYGLEDGRIDETFATTTVVLVNTGLTPYSFQANEFVVGNTVTGKAYNAAAFNIAATGFAGDTVDVDVIAVEPGSASNADPNDITTIVTGPPDITCTNPNPAVASDFEEDPALRQRMTAALVPISPAGAALAYESIALNATRPDGSSIGVTKVQTLQHYPDMGDVTVYLADGDGAPSAPDIAIIHDLILAGVRPVGVAYVDTLGATEISVDVTAIILAHTSSGLSAAEIEELAEDALIALFASPEESPIGGNVTGGPGGYLAQSKIVSVMEQVQAEPGEPFPVFDVSISDPPGNVTLSPGEVAVLGTVTLTVSMF